MLSRKVQSLLPWDKSLIIRFAFLDLINGRVQRSIDWLEAHYDELGDDLRALLQTLKQYLAGEDLDVGESGTLLRFWRYFLWMRGDQRRIITRGTLRKRAICNDPSIIYWELDELGGLDNETSQWMSIAWLMGKRGDIGRATPGHLRLTQQALQEWEQATKRGEIWPARKDKFITECVEAWLEWRRTGVMSLNVNNAEKFCLAVAFGLMTPKAGGERWPALFTHESNRVKAMKRYMRWWWLVVGSRDHRVVQALAMSGKRRIFLHRNCVNKTWPQFWRFLELFG